MRSRTLRSIASGTLILVALSSCGDDEQGRPTTTVENAADGVTIACERLKDLANAVLTIQSATSVEEVEEALSAPAKAFVDASRASGDARLAELATTYETNFERYLTSEGLDSREAADDVDITQDRAAQHCVVLGAMTIDEFPTNP
jgi:hypothetical protein